MWWGRVLLKTPGTVFEVLSCSGQLCTNKDVISIVLLAQFHPLINKKERSFSGLCYGCPDHHWGRALLPGHHTGFFISILRPNSIILGVKVVFNIEVLLITENDVWQRAILNERKKNLASLESFVNNLSRKLVFLDMLEWEHLQLLPENSWHGYIRHIWIFWQILVGSLGVLPSLFSGGFYYFGGLAVQGRPCLDLF